jgi:hypothetical protein
VDGDKIKMLLIEWHHFFLCKTEIVKFRSASLAGDSGMQSRDCLALSQSDAASSRV